MPAPSGYFLVSGSELRGNLRAKPTGAYGPGTVNYQYATVDMGGSYLRKASSNLSSADGDAFAGGQYFDGGAVQLNSKFAHKQYRPIGAASGGTTQIIYGVENDSIVGGPPDYIGVMPSVTGVFYSANYGSSGLYNLILVGSGGSGWHGVGLSGGLGGCGGGGGGTIAISGLNINGLAYSVGCTAVNNTASTNTTVGAAVAYTGGIPAGSSASAGGYSSRGIVNGAAGGAGKTTTATGDPGGNVAASDFYVDWTSVSIQHLAGGTGGPGIPGSNSGSPWFIITTGAGGGGASAIGNGQGPSAGPGYGGGGCGQGGDNVYMFIYTSGGAGAVYIMWNNS